MGAKTCGKLIVSFVSFLLVHLPVAALAYPQIGINDVTVSEGNGGTTVATFSVIRSESSTSSSVMFSTSGGTATEGGNSCSGSCDYLRMSSSLTFSTGEITKTIAIAVCGDTLDEADETFTVYLSSPSGASIADPQGQATILDDDPPPSLSIGGVNRNEGNSGQTNSTFTVTLAPPSGREVSVVYATSNDTATGGASCGAGVDYVNTNGTLRFAPGVSSQTINVPVCGDTWSESNEQFRVVLSNAVNATIQPGSLSGLHIIINDEPVVPVLSIGDVSVTEPSDRIGILYSTAVFTLSLSDSNHNGCSIDYACVSGTATSSLRIGICYNGDYSGSSGTVTFQPGERSKTISVMICKDTADEPNEIFQIRLSSPRGLTAPDLTAVGTIVDND
ncbi:MAG: Calx-beta domain-containing protein [Acidobacteriota bacterium]